MSLWKSSIRIASLLFLALLLLIATLLLIDRQQAQPPQLEMLHLRDCQLPCWIGIVPGKTTIGQAEILLTSTFPPANYEHTFDHSPYQNIDWYTINRRSDGTNLSINFNEGQAAAKQTNNTTVSQITFIWGVDPHLTLGHFATLLGKPQALSVTWGNHYGSPNALYYRQGIRLTFNKIDDFVVDSWNVEVGHLDIFANLKSVYPSNYGVPWHGWNKTYKEDLLALMLP